MREGRAAPPPGGPNSFNFMQFLGKFGKIVCWRPPGELASPPQGNPGSATAKSLLCISNKNKYSYCFVSECEADRALCRNNGTCSLNDLGAATCACVGGYEGVYCTGR